MTIIPPIVLISFGQFEHSFLEKCAESVSHEYQLPVKVKEGHIDLSEYYDATRGQYNGNKLLSEVEELFGGLSEAFGLFNVDLFIPILTYIFGQAFLNGRTGIAWLSFQ